MTREEDLQLLRLEMLRCIEIIDTTDFYNEVQAKEGWSQYAWLSKARSGRAELINKMHELRRDTIKIENSLLKIDL